MRFSSRRRRWLPPRPPRPPPHLPFSPMPSDAAPSPSPPPPPLLRSSPSSSSLSPPSAPSSPPFPSSPTSQSPRPLPVRDRKPRAWRRCPRISRFPRRKSSRHPKPRWSRLPRRKKPGRVKRGAIFTKGDGRPESCPCALSEKSRFPVTDRRMGSSENPNWFLECSLIDDIPHAGGDFAANDVGGLCWPPQGFNTSSGVSVDIDSPFVNSDGLKEPGSAKRVRSESCSRPASKACREKMRRERLNDRFMELSSLLDPGNPPKTDKAAILSDAARVVIQLRNEAQKLKDSNESLQEKIKELKAEKNELREEKQKLKAEKESLEQQVKLLNARPSFVPQPPLVPSLFPAQGQAAGHKLMVPVVGYPSFPMWQFMPPADVDTSQDADKCPPVA